MDRTFAVLTSRMADNSDRSPVARTAAAFAAAIVLVVLCAAKAARAEITRPVGFSTSIGYSHPGQSGLGVTAGVYGRFAPILVAGMLDITLVGGEPNTRYRSETLDNGNTVCRDTTNGQFAKKASCGDSLDALLGAMLEVAIIPIEEVFLGAGVRTGPSVGPYLVAGYSSSSASALQFWYLRGAVGRSFGQLHLGVGF